MRAGLSSSTRRRSLLLAAILMLPGAAPTARADASLVVAVNASAGTEGMSAREVRKLFLGKSRRLPDGSTAVLGRYSPLNSAFNRDALGRSDAQVGAAWSRLRFSGRSLPPEEFASLPALIEWLGNTPNAVAYLPDSALEGNDSVRVAHTVGD